MPALEWKESCLVLTMDYNVTLDTQLRGRCTLHCVTNTDSRTQLLNVGMQSCFRHCWVLLPYKDAEKKKEAGLCHVYCFCAHILDKLCHLMQNCAHVHRNGLQKSLALPSKGCIITQTKSMGESLGEREREERKLNWTSKVPDALNICKRIFCMLKSHSDLTCPTSGCPSLYAD